MISTAVGEGKVSDAISVLEKGGILVVPTIRWYMICCSASKATAAEKIFSAKKRPHSKQPLLLVPNHKVAVKMFQFSACAKKLIDYLWPGEISMYLNWTSKNYSKSYSFCDQEYALVSMATGLLGEIVSTFSEPVYATSVNISGEYVDENAGPAISVTEVNRFISETGIAVDLIFDGGVCPAFTHTTIVDCRCLNEPVKIIREGFVHRRAIKMVLENNERM
ncbi:MAG: Sua5/YciO/YrdC/YwlC family protein [Nitrososphaerota archaeon]|jgi:L-threonylcarbamoyladenylate synthase|nr:Sua5/YciO/YrdC/YwlC family protein [Nitrososphaerota archaeon]